MIRHWPGDRGSNIPGGRNSLYKDTVRKAHVLLGCLQQKGTRRTLGFEVRQMGHFKEYEVYFEKMMNSPRFIVINMYNN